MSRMRQALKNLEARFPSAGSPTGFPAATPFPTEMPPASVPTYFGALQALVDSSCAQMVVQPVIGEPVRVALAEPASRPPQPSLSDYLEQRTAPRPEVNESPPPAPPAAAATPLATAPQVNDADAPAWKVHSPKAVA